MKILCIVRPASKLFHAHIKLVILTINFTRNDYNSSLSSEDLFPIDPVQSACICNRIQRIIGSLCNVAETLVLAFK